MGKKVSELRSFIMEALRDGKYKQHLDWIDREKGIFKFVLPKVSKYSHCNELEIYKDWHLRNNNDEKNIKNTDDWSKVRHSLQVSLKKSVYFEKLDEKRLRFLTDDEIEEKRRKSSNKNKAKNVEMADQSNSSPSSVASSGYGSLDENMSDDFDQILRSVELPNSVEWENFEKFLYSANENGLHLESVILQSESVMLYKLKWGNVAGTSSVLCFEPSDFCLRLPKDQVADIITAGLFVENDDLLVKLLDSNVRVNKISDCLILLLENRAENVVPEHYEKVEVVGGDIYVLPEYFIFYSHNGGRK